MYKRYPFLICTSFLLVAVWWPSLSAHGRQEETRSQNNQMHNIEHRDMQREGVLPKYGPGVYDHRAYGSYGGYGGSYGATPIAPPAGSQPGMSDDSSALYRSYLRAN